MMTWTLAVVMIPPCSLPTLREGYALVQAFEVCSGLPRVLDYRKFGTTRLELASLDAEHAQIRSSSRQQPGMTHPSSSSMSSNYEPFTENRRWPSDQSKIARRRPPATPATAYERATQARCCAKQSVTLLTRP